MSMGVTGRGERWAIALAWLVACVGQAGFAVYIVAMYGASWAAGERARWNTVLPDLHVEGEALADGVMAIHLFAGAVLCLAGPLQLVPSVRAHAPAVHRWNGRFYVVCAAATSLAGLAFVGTRGTVGGVGMDLGFGLYGVLLGGAALRALAHARRGDVDGHRRWATRLFVLGASSFLYRVGYALWAVVAGGLVGHAATWDGPFDLVMDFAFYLVPLATLEAVSAGWRHGPRAGAAASVVVALTAPPMALGTLLVAGWWWLPAVLAR